MSSLPFFCIVLLLVAISVAQETDETVKDDAGVVTNEGNQTAADPPAEQPPATEVYPVPAVAEEQAEPVDVPVPDQPGQAGENVAAQLVEGSPNVNGTVLLTEPDAIKQVLGARCNSSKDCLSMNNTDCLDGLCNCQNGFIPSKHSMDTCIKVPSGLGDSCEEETQCIQIIPDSECRDSKCECPIHYIFEQGRCWEKQSLGGNCNISSQCEDITFATCTQGVCACESPLIPSPMNQCLQAAGTKYNAQCTEDIQCTFSYGDEARCSNGMCRCTNNFHFNGSTCIVDRKLGEACETDEDCAVMEGSNNFEGSRMCVGSSCACATGYTLLPGEEICTKSSGAEIEVSLAWLLCIVVAKYYLA